MFPVLVWYETDYRQNAPSIMVGGHKVDGVSEWMVSGGTIGQYKGCINQLGIYNEFYNRLVLHAIYSNKQYIGSIFSQLSCWLNSN